ncbi:hypothetical protein [Leucobacter aridicollis]|uniref:Uncharacterized protein n=1 Tax=Leucobacter aridicollis TaxID=283878 RepID=A0A852RHD8_9MICO|nr:hypothetical protein [Leucobacter aridicollis]MBL3682660.1 hypothetical protein [Leucobacter aridicollis]NYD26092.1 hypothetical protein [Leucobacter aridicollis]
MDIQTAVQQIRETLAPHLNDFSLEMLDVVMMDEEWEIAHAMCLESAEYHHIELSDALTLVP